MYLLTKTFRFKVQSVQEILLVEHHRLVQVLQFDSFGVQQQLLLPTKLDDAM
jgi:hypothetical protein